MAITLPTGFALSGAPLGANATIGNNRVAMTGHSVCRGEKIMNEADPTTAAQGASDDVLPELERYMAKISKYRADNPSEAERWLLHAIGTLVGRVKTDSLYVSEKRRFRSLLFNIFDGYDPDVLYDFFEPRCVSEHDRANLLCPVRELDESTSGIMLRRSAHLVRSLLSLPDDERPLTPLVIVSSIYIAGARPEPATVEPSTKTAGLSVGEGEFVGCGPLVSAIMHAIPSRPLQCIVATEGLEDWEIVTANSHVLTLGAADSNPLRAKILNSMLKRVSDGKIPLVDFPLTQATSTGIVDWFTNEENRKKAKTNHADCLERYIVLVDGGNDKVFDTWNGRFVEPQCESDLTKAVAERNLDGVERVFTSFCISARHHRLDIQGGQPLFYFSIEGTSTHGTACGALACADWSSMVRLHGADFSTEAPLSEYFYANAGKNRIQPAFIYMT